MWDWTAGVDERSAISIRAALQSLQGNALKDSWWAKEGKGKGQKEWKAKAYKPDQDREWQGWSLCPALGYAWADCYFLGVYMANISEYDAKIYFWGMVLFATVSFIALPAVAFIYLENRIINEQTKIALKKIEKLERKLTKEKEEWCCQ